MSKGPRLKLNRDFTLAGWPDQVPVPLFTMRELTEILNKNDGKVPEDMWGERIKISRTKKED
jgi:hypothetical protein